MMSFSKIIKRLGLVLGCLLVLLGILGVGFGILGILDPVGTQMADDGDPFGTPNTFAESLSLTAVYAIVLLSGLWLIFASGRKKLKLR